MSLLDKYCFNGEKALNLKDVPTNSKHDDVDKDKIIEKTAKLQAKIFELHDKMFSEGKEGLIIVLQARDAAGKDSTIRHVLTGVNPQGIKIYSYKQPSREELAHDFLWRCTKNTPLRGNIAIYNRSYYEDVLVVKVHELQKGYNIAERCKNDEHFYQKRYRQIRHYEDYLYESSYHIVKIFLNVSKDKQKERFLERVDRPEKNWKFSASDIPERELWSAYDHAFEDAINGTATKENPWYVIPADQKWYTRYLVSEAILAALEDINPDYPKMPKEQLATLADCKKKLLAEK